jgi:hypothetical protein
LELQTAINANPASSNYLSNAFVIFDYQGSTDFKFAGAYVGSNEWLIGHRTASGWVLGSKVSSTINTFTDYDLRVVIENDTDVTLFANGVQQVTHSFSGSLTDGEVGLGTRNAISRFDDLLVQQYTPPPPPPSGTLPIQDDFEDGQADFFQVRAGTWDTSTGEYSVLPTVGQDAISTLLIDDPLPTELELQTTINADPGTSNFLSNAFVIFDYQGPTDFKFAGSYVGANKWLIGHRTASDWVLKNSALATVNTLTDYDLRVVIENDSYVTLYANGVQQVTHSFSGSLTDGEVGLGTRNAISRFDDLLVVAYVEVQIQAQAPSFEVITAPPPPMPADPSAVVAWRLPEAAVDSIFGKSSTRLDLVSLLGQGVRRRAAMDQRVAIFADVSQENIESTEHVFGEYEGVLSDRWGVRLE